MLAFSRVLAHLIRTNGGIMRRSPIVIAVLAALIIGGVAGGLIDRSVQIASALIQATAHEADVNQDNHVNSTDQLT